MSPMLLLGGDEQRSGSDYRLNVQLLWEKYEDIAMHFNDLLLRLRTQALAGIAAVSTFVGIFAKAGPADVRTDWLVAACIFSALAAFWVAIAVLDLFYYNRLLIGAVAALVDLEKTIRERKVSDIRMSTSIDDAFKAFWWNQRPTRFWAVATFYAIVLVVIVVGSGFSWHMHNLQPPPKVLFFKQV